MARRVNLLVFGMIAAVAVSTYLFVGQAHAKQNLKPWCSDPGPIPAEKLQLLKEKCASEEPSTSPNRKPYTPPNRDYQMDTATGILNEGGYIHTPLAKGKYTVVNAWADRNEVIYAGALEDDSAQGVVFVVNQAGDAPTFVAEVKSSSRDGALRFVEENGNSLALEAANGVTYTFDIRSRTLTRR